MDASAHAGRLAVGLSLSSALPLPPTRTHRPALVHDTADRPGNSIDVDQVPEEAALAVAYTLPLLATATHSAVTLHDTAVSGFVPSVSRVVCHDDMLVGFVDTRTLPALSAASPPPTGG